jgi:Domain of unknown function (DUF4265)
MTIPDTNVLIAFPVEVGTQEKLAAQPLTDSKLKQPFYQLISIPFLVADISYGDIVYAVDKGGELTYGYTRKPSSYSAVAVRTLAINDEAEATLMNLAAHWKILAEHYESLHAFAAQGEGLQALLTCLDQLAEQGWCEYAIMADRRELQENSSTLEAPALV